MAWVIIPIAVATFPTLLIPSWALRLVTMCVILGFPVAVILAWAFELTPEGIKTTKSVQANPESSPFSQEDQKKRSWMAYAVGR